MWTPCYINLLRLIFGFYALCLGIHKKMMKNKQSSKHVLDLVGSIVYARCCLCVFLQFFFQIKYMRYHHRQQHIMYAWKLMKTHTSNTQNTFTERRPEEKNIINSHAHRSKNFALRTSCFLMQNIIRRTIYIPKIFHI